MRRVMMAAGAVSRGLASREGFAGLASWRVGVWESRGVERLEARVEVGERKAVGGSGLANWQAIAPDAGARQGKREAEKLAQADGNAAAYRGRDRDRDPIHGASLSRAFPLPSSPRHKPAPL
jgi:hypothetical protein